MTQAEVMNKWIWLPRLQMKAGIHFNKKYTELTEQEEYEIRLIILEEQAEREAKEQALKEHYKKYGYSEYSGLHKQ